MPWQQIDLAAAELANADESALRGRNAAALENCFISDAPSLRRFPGLKPWATLEGSAPLFLAEWRGDLIAVERGGRVYRLRQDGSWTNVTRAHVTGAGRPTFAKTEFELLIAAGGPIVRLSGSETEVLPNAPESTHVCFIAGRVVAIEPRSGRFTHTAVGVYDSWDPLDTFSAEGKPDDLVAAVVTPFGELLLVGSESIEQFDPVAGGDQPFFRRWMIGDGILAPYTLVAADNGIWGVNARQEWSRFSGQVSEPASQAKQQSLDAVDDWTDAWASEITVAGQRFFLIQAPRATNLYGTAGVTLLYDYRKGRWGSLYGWDREAGLPARWPGWSYKRLWGRHFVGGEGVIYELDPATFTNAGLPQHMLWRSGHIERPEGPMWVHNLRLRMKRGIGPGQVSVRVNRDARGFGRAKRVAVGGRGDRAMRVDLGNFGTAQTWQFELSVTDAVEVDIAAVSFEAIPEER
jgi:hypothetical protein